MAIKTKLSSLDEAPEALRHEYVERDGAFVLQVEGPAPDGYASAIEYASVKRKQQEYRDRNHSLLNDAAQLAGVERTEDMGPVRALIERYRAVDLNEYEKLKANAAQLATKGVKQPEDIRSIVMEAVEPLKAELESERAARQEAQRKNDQSQLSGEISTAFLEAGGRPAALEFLTTQARDVFEVVDGEVQARPGQYSKRQAGEPLPVAEWMEAQTQAVGFAFGDSAGGGAVASTAGTNNSGSILRDPTPQELGRHAKAITEGRMKIVNS
jgi:hypothetical protein